MGAGGALVTVPGLSAFAAAAEDAAVRSSLLSGAGVSLIADALRKIGQNPMKLVMTTDIKPLVNVGCNDYRSCSDYQMGTRTG